MKLNVCVITIYREEHTFLNAPQTAFTSETVESRSKMNQRLSFTFRSELHISLYGGRKWKIPPHGGNAYKKRLFVQSV